MCSISFYTNHNYGGDSVSFSGPQGQSGNLMDGIDSLKTGSNTWVVVYSDKNYGGDFMKIGPSTSNSDLNKTDRGDSGDWKNQIQSFVMYASKPSFWDGSSGTPTIPLAGCEVFFTEDTDFLGGTLLYNSATSVADLSSVFYTDNYQDTAGNTINSLKTGSGAWMVIYNEKNYTGDSKQVYPNTKWDDLNDVSRGDSGDWKNQILSFQLYNQLPADWSLSFNLSTFHSLFPDAYSDSTVSGGSAIGYRTQDAQYRIYDPQVSYPTSGTMQVNVVIDHIINMSTDDHVTLGIVFDSDGTIDSVNYTWDAGSAYQIPDGVIKAVDAGVELAGAVGALETCGISEAAAEEFLEVFDTACKAFNDISKLVNKWSENDGGRFYLTAVICHVINRVAYSVTKS